jgi:ariadne-1
VTYSLMQPAIVSILLRQFRWNKDRLLDAYMESSDSVLKSSGEPPSPIRPPSKRARITPVEFVCDVCCDTPSESDVYKERCGHKFCNGCWEAYITCKVKDEGQCIVTCMQEGCQTVLEGDTIQSLADAQCYERYILLFQYILHSSYLHLLSYESSDIVH